MYLILYASVCVCVYAHACVVVVVVGDLGLSDLAGLDSKSGDSIDLFPPAQQYAGIIVVSRPPTHTHTY